MPIPRISLLKGKSPEYLRALADSVHKALVEAYEMPNDDRFQIIDQYDRGTLIFDRNYGGGPRSDDFVMILVSAGRERSPEVKRAFYKRLVATLGESPGIRPEDVFIRLECTSMDDFSFGSGLPALEAVGAAGQSAKQK